MHGMILSFLEGWPSIYLALRRKFSKCCMSFFYAMMEKNSCVLGTTHVRHDAWTVIGWQKHLYAEKNKGN